MVKSMSGVLSSESKPKIMSVNKKKPKIWNDLCSNNTERSLWKPNRRRKWRSNLTKWPGKMSIITCRRTSSWRLRLRASKSSKPRTKWSRCITIFKMWSVLINSSKWPRIGKWKISTSISSKRTLMITKSILKLSKIVKPGRGRWWTKS